MKGFYTGNLKKLKLWELFAICLLNITANLFKFSKLSYHLRMSAHYNWNLNLHWFLWNKENQSSRMLGQTATQRFIPVQNVGFIQRTELKMLTFSLWCFLAFCQKFPTVGGRGQKSWPRTTLPSNKSSLFKVSYSISFTLLWS